MTIQLSFPWGRYYAHPWGINPTRLREAEWPPSPWRLLRALVSAWFRAHPGQVPSAECIALIESLGRLKDIDDRRAARSAVAASAEGRKNRALARCLRLTQRERERKHASEHKYGTRHMEADKQQGASRKRTTQSELLQLWASGDHDRVHRCHDCGRCMRPQYRDKHKCSAKSLATTKKKSIPRR